MRNLAASIRVLEETKADKSQVDSLVESIDDMARADEVAEALSNKQNTSDRNEPNGYAGLDPNGLVPMSLLLAATVESARAGSGEGVMTPPLVKEAIDALGVSIVSEVYTSSGTFTRHADDVAYLVQVVDGGSGGDAAAGHGSYSAMPGGAGGAGGESRFFPADIVVDLLMTIENQGGAGLPINGTRGGNGGAGGDGPDGGGGLSGVGSNGNSQPVNTGGQGGNGTYPGAGGGGGGGSGRSSSNISIPGGAGGKSGKSTWYPFVPHSMLPPSFAIVVGSGGAGGVAPRPSPGTQGGHGGAGMRGEIRVWRIRK